MSHSAPQLILMAAFVLAMAACTASAPTGPQQPGTATPGQAAGLLGILSTDTPTSTPAPTLTPTPTSTPTPLPTPTPIAALSVGSLPAGQVLFSTQRTGEDGEQLWRVSAGDGLEELLSDLLPGGWRCVAADEPICAYVTLDRALYALQPMTGTTTLLDDLNPVVLSTATIAITPTMDVTGTAAISPTTPITTTPELTTTQPISHLVTLSPGHPNLALSPDGQRLAVATDDLVTVYDLTEPALLATLQAGGPAELAWSPEGQRLALAYPSGEGNAVALWSLVDGRLRVLAQMVEAGRVAWAPDGLKLAFDARTSPATPSHQSSQPDVYVLTLRSGEILNLTELFPRNRGVDPSRQIGGWAPQWEADSETVRYVRGIPGRIEEQNVVRQALRSRSPTVLWPAADEGRLGVITEPDGQRLARVVWRDGRDVVQLRVGGGWQDASPGTFAGLAALVWSPVVDDEDETARLLLLADRQALLLIDPTAGSISGLAVACPDCVVTQAVWLPSTTTPASSLAPDP